MKKNNIKKHLLGIVSIFVIVAAIGTIMYQKNNNSDKKEGDSQTVESASGSISSTDKDGNIVINVSDVSEKATFYSYKELDNEMEVIAVKASDGTIRTAFNTCQVCYGSGKAYYEQEGDILVCQNCGNQFTMDDVEIVKGGCNPVPITDEFKEVTDATITIKKDTLLQAESIFDNWKN